MKYAIRIPANDSLERDIVIAYNLGDVWRRLGLPQRIKNWSLASLHQRRVKTGGRSSLYGSNLVAPGGEPSDAASVRGVVQRIAGLPVPAG